MQPLMVFFWRSSRGWMKCPQIRACSGSGAAETKSRRKRDRAAGAFGQISGLDQLSCGGDSLIASHWLNPGFVSCASLPFPEFAQGGKSLRAAGCFSSQARALGATLRETGVGTFVGDSPGERLAKNGFGSHLGTAPRWSRQQAGATD